jgi:hypothetical protein
MAEAAATPMVITTKERRLSFRYRHDGLSWPGR